MADNVAITAGSGTTIATDDVSGVQFQKVKLDVGGDGATVPAVGTAGGALYVNLRNNSAAEVGVDAAPIRTSPATGAAVQPVSDNSGSLTVDDGSGSLTVDAPATTPVFVRLSSGSAAVDALPVTDNGSTLSVDDGSGSLTVDGTVTANQGTAASLANAWAAKLTDGTSSVGVSTVASEKALKVDIIQSVGVPALADKAAFTEGSGLIGVAAGVYNDTISSDPTEDHAAALRLTVKRGLHANLRDNDGNELGTGTSPITVTRKGGGEVRVSTQLALTASQTGVTIVTPTSGKKFGVRKIILVASVAGVLTLFDQTNSASTIIFKGTLPAGVTILDFDEPFISDTVDNILKYTSGTGLVAEITVHGFDADSGLA